jgi:hypothetical protein
LSPRAQEYERHYQIEIPGNSFYERYIVVRFDVNRGQVTRCAISYELVILGGRRAQVVRYDDADGGFHRHHPGFPKPDLARTTLHSIDNKAAIKYACQEIREKYKQWEQEIMPKIFEDVERVNHD